MHIFSNFNRSYIIAAENMTFGKVSYVRYELMLEET